MAIAIQTLVDTITGQIEQDLTTALDLVSTQRDAPQTDTDSDPAALPCAYVLLAEANPDSEEGSIGEEGFDLVFEILVRAEKPDTSQPLQLSRTALLEQIRGALTQGARFHGRNREWLGETLIPADDGTREMEATAIWLQVAARFQVTITVAAT